jgi:hypothetical protein
MNRYDCELVRDGQKWRFKRVTIDNAWTRKFSTRSQVAKRCARNRSKRNNPGHSRETLT